ncbi:MAG: hypothetical protein AAAFM81_13230 [Pseudomonadota bacterium]
MINCISARVPGKVMLAGEYGVLAGGSAILACVDRYCEVSLVANRGQHELVTRGYKEGRYTFTIDEHGRCHFDDVTMTPKLRLPLALVEEMPPRKPMRLTVDTTAFFDGRRKLGLGSSAAVAYALAAVLGVFNSDPEARRGALNAHGQFQGGRGSGADIYAVSKGGVIGFKRNDKGARIVRLDWPSRLHATVLQMRESASTVSHVSRFEQWRRDDDSAEAFLKSMRADSRALVSVWRESDETGIIEALQALTARMFELNTRAKLGYLDGGHAELSALGERHGVFVKPCGAGGGDIAIAVSDDAARLETLINAAAESGINKMPVSLGIAEPEVVQGPVKEGQS